MKVLYQRLKELSKEDFESLIDQLLQARYPLAGITRVNGAGGDGGVDSYHGRLGSKLAIWQDKHFPDGIGESQRKQILKSIKTALEKNRPFRWTLCVPVDLNPTERKWFDVKVVDVYSKEVKVELLQASHIVFHLNNYKRIREAFFPDAVTDLAYLKQLVMNAEVLEPKQKALLGVEYLNQYTESLEASDARFRYEVTTASGEGPLLNPKIPGLLASVFDGSKRVNLFANDVAALNDDPIRLLVKLSREAAAKMDAAVRTGRGTSFETGDILEVELPLPIRSIVGQVSLSNLQLEPRISQERRLVPMKMTCGTGSEALSYDYVPFRVQYLGTDEVTLVSDSNLPLDITLRAPLKGGDDCDITVDSNYGGKSFASVRKAFNFTAALFQGKEVEMVNLETGQLFLRFLPSEMTSTEERLSGLDTLIAHGQIVSAYLGGELPYPTQSPTEDDYELLEMLKFAATGETFEVTKLALNLRKGILPAPIDALLQNGSAQQLVVEAPESQRVRVLFGTPINTGRMLLAIESTVVLEYPARTRARMKKAEPDDEVQITLRGPANARFMKTAS